MDDFSFNDDIINANRPRRKTCVVLQRADGNYLFAVLLQLASRFATKEKKHTIEKKLKLPRTKIEIVS